MNTTHNFLNIISMDTVDTLPVFVPYKEEKRNVLKMLQYDYAAVIGEDGNIIGAKHLWGQSLGAGIIILGNFLRGIGLYGIARTET